jgi:hypothetical protein
MFEHWNRHDATDAKNFQNSVIFSITYNAREKLDKVPAFCPEAISKFD